jgi:hypothetical protein
MLAATTSGLRSHWGRASLRRLPLRCGFARREDDHGRTPVRKALTPKQIRRLQMAELYDLRQFRIGQRPELLAFAREIPLRLYGWRCHAFHSGRSGAVLWFASMSAPTPF